MSSEVKNLNVESCALKIARPVDIVLNDAVCWRNVLEAVWDYTFGGYQVVKKWLSYREKGTPATKEAM